MKICKKFTFDAAHMLPLVPAGHKCNRLHGHTFVACICVSGEVNKKRGWVCDFAHIKSAFNPILEMLDHSYLNDIDGLSNPTSESICKWIWDRLVCDLPNLSKVTVYETPDSWCSYTGIDRK